MKCHTDGTELLQVLLSQVELLTSTDDFYRLYGFTLQDYLSNRGFFSKICREHADHIEQFVKGSGIARTVGGSMTIIAGGVAILGIILAPFSLTVAASLGLTVGGVVAGIVGAGTSVTAGIVKDSNIRSDKKEIEEALEKFENQEEIINNLLKGVYESLNKLSYLMKKGPTEAVIAFKGLAGASGVAINGVRLAKTVGDTVKFADSAKLASFANNVSNFMDPGTVITIAEGAAAPGLRVFGKAVVVAGTTTAKVFSGVFSAFGIGFGVWDIVTGTNDIKGSEIANAYLEFAAEYDKNTTNLITGVEQLSSLLDQICNTQ